MGGATMITRAGAMRLLGRDPEELGLRPRIAFGGYTTTFVKREVLALAKKLAREGTNDPPKPT